MIDFNKTFKTNKVILRPISLDDLDEMYALTSVDPEMWIYFTVDLSDKAILKKGLEAAINDKQRLALTVLDVSNPPV